MCGRFTLTASGDAVAERFSFSGMDFNWIPSFNIAPTQLVPTVTNNGVENRATLMRWGLVPNWAKDSRIANRMINARSETLAEKPSFRRAFLQRRCLIPADGFYEWRLKGGQKIPNRITLGSDSLFAFAGLWESWTRPNGSTLFSCVIITTSPNDVMAPIHGRMPVILPQESESFWLDPGRQDTDVLARLLLPRDIDGLNAYEVSTLVNSPNNNSEAVTVPVNKLF